MVKRQPLVAVGCRSWAVDDYRTRPRAEPSPERPWGYLGDIFTPNSATKSCHLSASMVKT